MSKTYTGSTKCCATCANWGGPRTEKFGSSEVASVGDRGKCYAGVPCSVTQGPCSSEGGSCAKYQKWPALK